MRHSLSHDLSQKDASQRQSGARSRLITDTIDTPRFPEIFALLSRFVVPAQNRRKTLAHVGMQIVKKPPPRVGAWKATLAGTRQTRGLLLLLLPLAHDVVRIVNAVQNEALLRRHEGHGTPAHQQGPGAGTSNAKAANPVPPAAQAPAAQAPATITQCAFNGTPPEPFDLGATICRRMHNKQECLLLLNTSLTAWQKANQLQRGSTQCQHAELRCSNTTRLGLRDAPCGLAAPCLMHGLMQGAGPSNAPTNQQQGPASSTTLQHPNGMRRAWGQHDCRACGRVYESDRALQIHLGFSPSHRNSPEWQHQLAEVHDTSQTAEAAAADRATRYHANMQEFMLESRGAERYNNGVSVANLDRARSAQTEMMGMVKAELLKGVRGGHTQTEMEGIVNYVCDVFHGIECTELEDDARVKALRPQQPVARKLVDPDGLKHDDVCYDIPIDERLQWWLQNDRTAWDHVQRAQEAWQKAPPPPGTGAPQAPRARPTAS